MIEVSVIIPIYNMEAYLHRCLDSLQAQGPVPLEIICVNDGSQDASLAICQDYAKRDKRIVVIDKPNGGVSSARNAGLAQARGRYIAWVDPDDYVTDDWYRTLAPYLGFYDMIGFGHALEQEGQTGRLVNSYRESNQVIAWPDYVKDLVIDQSLQSQLCFRIFRRPLLEGLSFREGIAYGEDYDFFTQLIQSLEERGFAQSIQIFQVAKPLYVYCMRQDGAVKSANLGQQAQALALTKGRYNYCRRHGYHVPPSGYLKTMLEFCQTYQVNSKKASSVQRRLSEVCLGLMRNYAWSILMDDYLSNRMKIKCLLLISHLWGLVKQG